MSAKKLTWIEEKKKLESVFGKLIDCETHSAVKKKRGIGKRTYFEFSPRVVVDETGKNQIELGHTIETPPESGKKKKELPLYGLFPLLCMKSKKGRLIDLYRNAPISELELTYEDNDPEDGTPYERTLTVELYSIFVLEAILWPDSLPELSSEILYQLYSKSPDWAVEYISEVRSVYNRRGSFAYDFVAMAFDRSEMLRDDELLFNLMEVFPDLSSKCKIPKKRDELQKSIRQLFK
jgi:hypothetical protein